MTLPTVCRRQWQPLSPQSIQSSWFRQVFKSTTLHLRLATELSLFRYQLPLSVLSIFHCRCPRPTSLGTHHRSCPQPTSIRILLCQRTSPLIAYRLGSPTALMPQYSRPMPLTWWPNHYCCRRPLKSTLTLLTTHCRHHYLP